MNLEPVIPAGLNFSTHRWRWLLPTAALLALFHFSPVARDLDFALFDLGSRHPLHPPPVPQNSAIVLIDDQTMQAFQALGIRWPFPRRYFAQLAAALHQAGASRIAMDFTFFEESDDDALLAGVVTAMTNVSLASTPGRQPVFWTPEFTREHARFFATPRTGNVEWPQSHDGIVRTYRAAGSLASAVLDTPPPGAGGYLRWHGGLKDIAGRGVPVLSAAPYIMPAGRKILEGLVADAPDMTPEQFADALEKAPALTGPLADAVRGRIVFVAANASGTFDFKPLPIGALEPGVLLHWTAWTNLATGGFITGFPRHAMLAVALLLGGAVVWAGRRQASLKAPVMMAAVLAAAMLLGGYAALSAGWFFPPATAVAGVMLGLLGIVAESFWLEQARKREIQGMFGAYVDPSVVERLVRDPESINLTGERREATVFFSDLAGFTDLSEKLQPEELVTFINAYLEETSECLLDHGAYVDKYIGDAVMAVFGAPQDLADHALAACRAALAAQRKLDGINERFAAGGRKLVMRIGLNTGDMIVGNLGSSRKKNYTVLGDTVNLASRLEGANKYFGTTLLIGQETARQIGDRMALRPLARLRVKGKATAVEVFTAHGDPAILPEDERAFLASYRAGYDAYMNGRFAEAVEHLERAAALRPGDQTTLYLRDHARQFSNDPPKNGWDPTLSLDSK